MKLNIRIGQGFDVHPFVENRRLVLGGVEIPYELGLGGHSDADVLSHAICDALLGAAGLNDIGFHFPDHDPNYENADSALFVSLSVSKLKRLGWAIGNIDCTIIAQEPKIAPYIAQMKTNLARLLFVTEDEIGIKATTTEHLGFTGRKEGIAAQAVALISRVR